MQQVKDTKTLSYSEGMLAHERETVEAEIDSDHGASRIPRFGLDFDLVPQRRAKAFRLFGRPRRKTRR